MTESFERHLRVVSTGPLKNKNTEGWAVPGLEKDSIDQTIEVSRRAGLKLSTWASHVFNRASERATTVYDGRIQIEEAPSAPVVTSVNGVAKALSDAYRDIFIQITSDLEPIQQALKVDGSEKT